MRSPGPSLEVLHPLWTEVADEAAQDHALPGFARAVLERRLWRGPGTSPQVPVAMQPVDDVRSGTTDRCLLTPRRMWRHRPEPFDGLLRVVCLEQQTRHRDCHRRNAHEQRGDRGRRRSAGRDGGASRDEGRRHPDIEDVSGVSEIRARARDAGGLEPDTPW